MKKLRKWTALAAAMAMTATLLTGCEVLKHLHLRQQLLPLTAAQQWQRHLRRPQQQTESWQQMYRRS